MPFTVTMPKLSPTMESGAIASWVKKEGDHVAAGDVLMEVSTDKATVEHTALDEGYLRKILVQQGDEAQVNQPIAIFTETADESIEGYKAEGAAPAPKPQVADAEPAAQSTPAPAPQAAPPPPPPLPPPTQPLAPTTKPSATGERIKASPLAKKLANMKGLDLGSVQGTGPGGRVVSRDLANAKPAGTTMGRSAAPTIPAGTFTEESMTPIRKVISKRLQEAKSTIPHFYVQQVINAEPLIALREQLSHLDYKVSFNDMIVKGTALALRKHPDMNSGFNAGAMTIVRYQTIDISVAVSLESGLITPIVRHADYKTLQEISSEIRELAKKAKDGKLAPHEFQGGSFTISNLGMYGVTQFIGIINPPQAGILSIGGILDQPVVRNGQVVPGKTMSLTLSADHRVVDGVAGAKFLKTLQSILENPAALLL